MPMNNDAKDCQKKGIAPVNPSQIRLLFGLKRNFKEQLSVNFFGSKKNDVDSEDTKETSENSFLLNNGLF